MGAVHAEPLLDASQIAANAAAIAAHVADGTIHFTEASIDHANILNIGVNSHAQIDTALGVAVSHRADATIHFTEGSIDHTAIANVGANSHAAIDSHIGDTNIHFADAPADANSYVRNNNAWVLETVQSFGEYRGTFDASGGVFPTTLNQGDWFNVTVAGTVDGQAFIVGDILVATVDSPSTTVFAGNWSVVPNISVTDHTLLTNIGVNTHAQLDTHLADATVHFTEASIVHANIVGIGVNTHAQIDTALGLAVTHRADATIHFSEASIDHLNIANIGTNSHATIDSNFVIVAAHIADATIHFAASTVGDVFKVGTPVNNQVGVWTGDGTLEGDALFTYGDNAEQVKIAVDLNVVDNVGLLFLDPDSGLNPDGHGIMPGQGGIFDGALIFTDDPTDTINNRNMTIVKNNSVAFGKGCAVAENVTFRSEAAGALAFFQPQDTTGREETKISFVGLVGGTGNEGVFSIEGFAYGDSGLQFHRLAHFVIDADYRLRCEMLGIVSAAGPVLAGDPSCMGFSAANGLELTGQGSVNDVSIFNDTNTEVIGIPTGTTRVNLAGTVAIAAGHLNPPSYTDTELDDITDAVNTSPDKVAGSVVFNSTQGHLVTAQGAADGSVWNDGAGTLTNTPV